MVYKIRTQDFNKNTIYPKRASNWQKLIKSFIDYFIIFCGYSQGRILEGGGVPLLRQNIQNQKEKVKLDFYTLSAWHPIYLVTRRLLYVPLLFLCTLDMWKLVDDLCSMHVLLLLFQCRDSRESIIRITPNCPPRLV